MPNKTYIQRANTAWCSTNRTYQSQQKHAIRIIFHKNKFEHTREHFKENNILNIYQLNIFNNLFLNRVKSGKAPNDLRFMTQPVSLEITILYYIPIFLTIFLTNNYIPHRVRAAVVRGRF